MICELNTHVINQKIRIDNTVYYDVKADDVLGWESSTATLGAESGTATLGDVTIPEPATLGLIAGAGLAVMGVRKFFRI